MTNSLTPGKPAALLSSVLPPLIFGSATFNNLYNKSVPSDTVDLVKEALELGVRAFDTSPYYGPSEELLGAALDTEFVHQNVPREDLFILTKVGRIASDEFDYSPSWVRTSVARSLERLRTSYLDVVYCHDVEFVSEDAAMEAVQELRRIRDQEGTIKYVGISGYPVDVLCKLAKRVLAETGEPLDVVMSYANFTLQNTRLATQGVKELRDAGVDVVPNASVLGMGLLRKDGVPVGAQGDWHPSSPGLRAAIKRASDFCDRHGEKLEVIAIRYALESWITLGESVGSSGDPASGIPWTPETNMQVGGRKFGVSVMGVSKSSELRKTLQVWRSILDGLESGLARRAGRWERDHEWSLNRRHAVQILADGVFEFLEEFHNYTWPSPPVGFINKLDKHGSLAVPQQPEIDLLTPAASPPPDDIQTAQEVMTIPSR
ncbi:Aldo/keto reductase [Myriangium duriaei CBS 260.36]|uniref:Aldo/keto reductase n=1 Tax=Myriangium duriaei CBS 260.36 TaxID=1168546 RepID=A0A9P4MJW1_9PEZI|nr:Aldo/keto reductase [Myriangium duriaei CBS 260.36]